MLLARGLLVCCSGEVGAGVTPGREEEDSLGYRAHYPGVMEGDSPNRPQ